MFQGETADFLAVLPNDPADLTESYYYLGSQQKEVILGRNLSLLIPYIDFLPGWVPWRKVSTSLGFGVDAIETAEQVLGAPFVWGSEFENVHATWRFDEPGFNYSGKTFAGSEQLYQLQKIGPPGSVEYEAAAKQFVSPCSEMDSYAQGRQLKLREDWKSVQDEAMQVAVRCKFTQSSLLRELLLSTNRFPLVSIKGDSYWGIGFKGKGESKLGKILVGLREELKGQAEHGRETAGEATCVRVDAHLHIWDSNEDEHKFAKGKEPPERLANNCTAEALLAQMDAADIGASLVVQPINYLFDHSYVATCIRRYPKRLMGMGLLNPALQPSEAVAQLEQLHIEGFSSFRFNPYLWPSGESMANQTGRALYQRAGELHCPIGVMAFKGLLLHADQMEVSGLSNDTNDAIHRGPDLYLTLDALGTQTLGAHASLARYSVYR
jgi:ribA/ribD-fused uncharacterized protein